MKKIWILILWLCSIFLVWNFTQAKDYEYTNLNITANILEDWTIDVKEDFSVDFLLIFPLAFSIRIDTKMVGQISVPFSLFGFA